MRDLILSILFSSTLVSCYASSESEHCLPSNIKGQVLVTKKVGKKFIEEEIWTTLPPEISIHSGEYRKLKFKSGFQMKITYKDKSGSKEITKRLNKEYISDIDFTKWFDKVYTFNGGLLIFELYTKEQKKVCSNKMVVTGGD
mgnify:CR=1 FL=1